MCNHAISSNPALRAFVARKLTTMQTMPPMRSAVETPKRWPTAPAWSAPTG
jgi:hypothetical protein